MNSLLYQYTSELFSPFFPSNYLKSSPFTSPHPFSLFLISYQIKRLDDYCSWIQKINEETLLKFGNTFNNAKNAWQGSADKGKSSVQLNLLEIEKWAAAQSAMEEEEEDSEEEEEEESEDEESDEEEEESDNDEEEEDKEDEKGSKNIIVTEPVNNRMTDKQSPEHDSNTGKAGTIPDHLRPKVPFFCEPTDYLTIRRAEAPHLRGREGMKDRKSVV